ncbi:MAG: T9SS type A sorting domain-containing protein, partial [Bacteroidota bacterium]
AELGYGARPPALGMDMLSGAEGMLYFENISPNSPAGNPDDGRHAYAYLNLQYADGTPITQQGFGYNPDSSAPPTNWAWPGAPEAGAFWSEFDADDQGTAREPFDRRFLLVAEPFELGPGATHTVDLAILWARGTSNTNSVAELRSYSDRVQAAYDAGQLFAPAGLPTSLTPLEIYPNPARDEVTVAYRLPANGATALAIYDILGREVARVDNRRQAAGLQRVRVRTDRLAGGAYVAVVTSESGRQSQLFVVAE